MRRREHTTTPHTEGQPVPWHKLRLKLRSVIGGLVVTAASFEFAHLVNTDPSQIELEELERRLGERLRGQVLNVYGISIRQIGIKTLTLPSETLVATAARMHAERQTAATERMAAG